jgi:hypothetical protein
MEVPIDFLHIHINVIKQILSRHFELGERFLKVDNLTALAHQKFPENQQLVFFKLNISVNDRF